MSQAGSPRLVKVAPNYLENSAGPVALTTAEVTVLQAPANGRIIIDRINLAEYAGATPSIKVRRYQGGVAPNDSDSANLAVVVMSVYGQGIIEGPLYLVNGARLCVKCTANSQTTGGIDYRQEV